MPGYTISKAEEPLMHLSKIGPGSYNTEIKKVNPIPKWMKSRSRQDEVNKSLPGPGAYDISNKYLVIA